MIVTVTPNPSLDLTLELAELVRGAVQRASGTRVDAGGKGVNVARALLANDRPVRAVLPTGGAAGDHHLCLLASLGLEVHAVPVKASTRTNVSIVEPDGTVTKINASGPRLDEVEVEALMKTAVASLDGAAWLAASGALPPGAPPNLYARFVREARAAGCRIAIDASGPALAAALEAAPDVVKPNESELAGAVGRPLHDLGDVVRAAEDLRRRGAKAVIVSLGPLGAVLVDGTSSCHARPPSVVAKSNVGAGDAALAGFLASGGSGPDALRSAVAWGVAAARLPGSAMPGPRDIDVDSVSLMDIDPAVELRGGV